MASVPRAGSASSSAATSRPSCSSRPRSGSSCAAFGYSIGLGDLVFINVTVALLAGLLPVPGGIGVTEGGLIYGLTTAGMPETTAFAAVIFYRMASFYVPPIWGFFALRWLEKNKHL